MAKERKDRLYRLEEMPEFWQLEVVLAEDHRLQEEVGADRAVTYDDLWEKRMDLWARHHVDEGYWDVGDGGGYRPDFPEQILAHEQALAELGLEEELGIAAHLYYYAEKTDGGLEEGIYGRIEYIGVGRLFDQDRQRYIKLMETTWNKWEAIQEGKIEK